MTALPPKAAAVRAARLEALSGWMAHALEDLVTGGELRRTEGGTWVGPAGVGGRHYAPLTIRGLKRRGFIRYTEQRISPYGRKFWGRCEPTAAAVARLERLRAERGRAHA